MPFTVTTRTGVLSIDAEEHRVEGSHHVFRTSRAVMGAPRMVVVRRLPRADVVSVTAG
jgi:hypothetical protein